MPKSKKSGPAVVNETERELPEGSTDVMPPVVGETERERPGAVAVEDMVKPEPPAEKQMASLYMRNDPQNLPVSFSIVSPTGQCVKQSVGSGETLTSPVFYRFERGKSRPVHPDDFVILESYKVPKNGTMHRVFGSPDDEAPTQLSLEEQVKELRASIAGMRTQTQALGITADAPANQLSSKQCECGNINAVDATECMGCGKAQ